jgi:hypothetical protein
VRATDLLPPPVAEHPARPAWMAWRLVIALQIVPQGPYAWDDPDLVWDQPDRWWDDPNISEGFRDVFCDYTGLSLAAGEPDEHGLFRAGTAQLTLIDPGDGRYRRRGDDGRLLYYATGRRLAVYALDPDDVPWWLFSGRVTEWRDPMDSTQQITVTAYCGAAELAQDPGRDWSPGAESDFPAERAAAIVAAAAYPGAVRADFGDVPLSRPEPAATSAWELLQQAQLSDGGIVFCDADDTLVLRDRRWTAGRPDQTDVPLLTDNVCDVPGAVVVWGFEATDQDEWLAASVTLQNDADPPLVATATAPPTAYLNPTQRYSHPGNDLWKVQADGAALADDIIAARSVPRFGTGSAAVYLHDQRFDYWRATLDRRIGDHVRYQHVDVWTDGTESLIDAELIVATIRHDITPETWIVALETTPSIATAVPQLWDLTVFAWDDPDPANVWR